MSWLKSLRSWGGTHLRSAGAPSHGVGGNPGMPHLAAAQIPGPGVGHVLAGETGTLSDDAADPLEKEGHVGRTGRGKRRPRHRSR